MPTETHFLVDAGICLPGPPFNLKKDTLNQILDDLKKTIKQRDGQVLN